VPETWLKANGAKLSAGYWAKYGPRPGCTIQVANEPVPLEEAMKA
jgi:peptide-methionine (S)-S-oxide reductase